MEKLKLTFLGTGSAFIAGGNNFNSNMLIQYKGKTLLIDCGSDARHSLHKTGLQYNDIENVYISHLHADHVGGLEWLALTNKFNPDGITPRLYACESIISDLWKKTLSGGLETIAGEEVDLNSYFNVHSIENGGRFKWHGIEFQTVQTIHVVNAYSFMPSFGLMFKVNGKCIFITTDTQFAPKQLLDLYDLSDIIFHDCETSPNKSGVHAHYTDLITLDKKQRKKSGFIITIPSLTPCQMLKKKDF